MILKSKKEACIGLSVEGDQLKLAAVARVGKKMRVLTLASTPVQTHKFANTTDDELESSTNSTSSFDFDQTDDAIDYQSVRDFLSNHLKRHIPLAVTFGEPIVRTLVIRREPKQKKNAVLKTILAEIQHLHNVELTKDMVDYAESASQSVLAVARLEASPLLDIFAMPTGTERRPMNIGYVSSNDVALINMVHMHFRFQTDEVVHVIHVGLDETKLFILRGNEVVHISPVIMQGSRDRDVAALLLTRLELEADAAGLPSPSHVVLSGHAERIGLRGLIEQYHPSVIMHSLSRLRVASTSDDSEIDFQDYIIPISAAWQYLEGKTKHFHRFDVLPMRLRSDQNKFKLSWHGYVFLLALFGSTTALTLQGLNNHSTITEQRAALNFERQQIKEQMKIVERINTLEARSADVIKATTTLDTLLKGAEMWSMTLDTLASGVNSLRTLWISEMKPTEKGVNVSGFSLNRSNVPNFATLSGGAKINEIAVQEIGKKKVFRYSMDLDVPSLAPYGNSRAANWHRNLAIPQLSGGGMGSPDTKAQQKQEDLDRKLTMKDVYDELDKVKQ